ncbi:MAG: peptide chain release factor N(5)-glutamine methyltransferase [Candidatus Saccharimonadales bacterium]
MNESSKLTLLKWLEWAQQALTKADITTARLDSQVLAAHVLGVNKAWLLAHPEHIIDAKTNKQLNAKLKQRLKRMPMAYVLGSKEFYGREFKVTPDVLTPRPETEQIITFLKDIQPTAGQRLVDVGTGSGAIAITAKLEYPHLVVEACDISQDALGVARTNAKQLGAKVRFFTSNLLEKVRGPYDIIVANLPYVDAGWKRGTETNYEPSIALFAEDKGLALIKQLIDQAPAFLSLKGYLIIEADPRQHDDIIAYANEHFTLVSHEGYALVFTDGTLQASP